MTERFMRLPLDIQGFASRSSATSASIATWRSIRRGARPRSKPACLCTTLCRVRAQPGGAGTILNNLVALGVGRIVPVGFCGDDGEGYELRRELASAAWRGARSFRDQPGAPDVHLLQASGHRAGPRARRAEPARLQELDTHARDPGGAAGRWTSPDRPADGRADRAGTGGSGRDGRRDAGFA